MVVKKNGKRKANTNTLAAIFHNWTYAGWVTSKANNIPPKTIRGNWEPIVTTEEFERGLAILDKRDQKRGRRRRHDYLLKGLVYFHNEENQLIKLCCSTSNVSRATGGNAYYCVPRSNINFVCERIDQQIAEELTKIEVDTLYLPSIRAAYTEDIGRYLVHLQPDEREQLEAALKTIDEEEARMARLFAEGKITDSIWDTLWREWQDRRATIRTTLDNLQQTTQMHISNLDMALEVIARAGFVYNGLGREDKKSLIRQMIEKVIIDPEGKIRLELRSPFAYLRDISHGLGQREDEDETQKADDKASLGEIRCSDSILSCGEDRIRTCVGSPLLAFQASALGHSATSP